MTEPISVIVVNWNGLDHLKRCLPALQSQTVADLEILVVDNGSTDGSVAWITEALPSCKVIRNTRNRGFAVANNQGIDVAQGRYIALLNNDAYPEPRWLENLLLAAAADEGIGMVASQILLREPAGRLDSAGIEVDRLGVAWNRCYGEAPEGSSEPADVFGPSAAAALYRRAMLQEIGGFDARYFMYYEDVELAWRARRAGWRCVYQPTARVLHVHSATAGSIPGFKAYHLGLNKWRTLLKHYPFGKMVAWLPALLIVDAASWLWPLLARGDTNPLKGRLDAWGDRRALWSERHDYGDPAEASGILVPPQLTRYRSGLR